MERRDTKEHILKIAGLFMKLERNAEKFDRVSTEDYVKGAKTYKMYILAQKSLVESILERLNVIEVLGEDDDKQQARTIRRKILNIQSDLLLAEDELKEEEEEVF